MKFSMFVVGCILLSACKKNVGDSLALQLSSNGRVDNVAGGKETHHARTALDEYSFNDCTGEWMHMTGTVIVSSHLVQNGLKWLLAGELHYLSVQGVGETTGKIYHFIGHSAAHEYDNFTFDYPWIKTYTANSLFVWRSRDEAFWWRVSLKLITDASGSSSKKI
jgi:hypothetical protein